MEGMAFEESFCSESYSFFQAVFFYGLMHVIGASGVETAVIAQEWGDEEFVPSKNG
jgi:hypothetical protein